MTTTGSSASCCIFEQGMVAMVGWSKNTSTVLDTGMDNRTGFREQWVIHLTLFVIIANSRGLIKL
jgi:hypothetical protein